MDLAAILEGAQLAIKLANMAMQIGQDAAPHIKTAFGIMFEGKVLTANERAAMLAQETAWREDIDAAIAADDAATPP